MNPRKIVFLAAAATILFSTAAALQYQVDIPALRNASIIGTDYQNTTSGVHEFNTSVENIGSAGCRYRLEGTYSYEDISKKQYSSELGLWPGSTETAHLYFVPLNYTGQVNASVEATYCGYAEHVTDFSFTMQQAVNTSRNFTEKVRNVNRSAAEVSFQELESGRLVPAETPPFWKVSPAEVRNGTAVLQYDPALFRYGENITYLVARNGSIDGKTEVYLKEKPGLFEKAAKFLKNILP